MSMKKATPKAVFEACEQLELLEKAWNRDDVRMLVGGGSFSVIDPLIQAWRQLQPVREVAPSLPSDLLLQVATMLEQQVSEYIAEVELRDKTREETLLALNETAAQGFQRREQALEDKLDTMEQANHQLEAELARLVGEVSDNNQALQALELKLQVSEEAALSLNSRLQEQKRFYESALKEQKQSQLDDAARIVERHQQQVNQLKIEAQQQLALQKAELVEVAETTENRLLRLLDQGRSELKEQGVEFNRKTDELKQALQAEKQITHSQTLEIKALTSGLKQAQQNRQDEVQQQKAEAKAKIDLITQENASLKQQLAQYQDQGSSQEKSDLQQLKESIRLLQQQMQGRQK